MYSKWEEFPSPGASMCLSRCRTALLHPGYFTSVMWSTPSNALDTSASSTIPIFSEPGVHYSNWSRGAVCRQISILIFAHAENCRHGLVPAAPVARVPFLSPCHRPATPCASPAGDLLNCSFIDCCRLSCRLNWGTWNPPQLSNQDSVLTPMLCCYDQTEKKKNHLFSSKANKAFRPCWCRGLQGKFTTSNFQWFPSLSGNHGKFLIASGRNQDRNNTSASSQCLVCLF